MNTYESNFVLDNTIKKSLLEQAKKTVFREYKTDRGTSSELLVASSGPNKGIVKTDEIRYLENLINKKFVVNTVVFLKFLPGASIFPHVDDSLLRTSCITWALTPDIKNFSPVFYHKSFDDFSFSEIKYYSEKPLILNTRNVHSMKNNNFERISIQLCLSNPITELVLADLNGDLFVK